MLRIENKIQNLTLSYRTSLSLIGRGKDFYVVKSEGEVQLSHTADYLICFPLVIKNKIQNLTLSYRTSLSLLRRGKDCCVVKSEGEIQLSHTAD